MVLDASARQAGEGGGLGRLLALPGGQALAKVDHKIKMNALPVGVLQYDVSDFLLHAVFGFAWHDIVDLRANRLRERRPIAPIWPALAVLRRGD